MNESFLHYLWKYRLFDQRKLKTDTGEAVEILRTGEHNSDSGPDFFNARLKIAGTLWAGNVEIHMHSSDWRKHNHHNDPAYDQCILHVVFENDGPAVTSKGTVLPVIELKKRFLPHLWDNYLKLLGTHGFVSCQSRLDVITTDTWKELLRERMHERLVIKTEQFFSMLKNTGDDWEECFHRSLARNFGFRVNAQPFEMLACALPRKLLLKYADQLTSVESICFGQAGFLGEDFSDPYPRRLQEDFNHFSRLHGLSPMEVSTWKFSRLRPVNFPTIRLAQFAALFSSGMTSFMNLKEIKSSAELRNVFCVSASGFWNTHYTFSHHSSYSVKRLGKSSAENIIINTLIPFMFAWGKYFNETECCERAFALAESIPPEENFLITKWREVGVNPANALESQAMLQLKTRHCAEKKCLTCRIGNQLINSLP